MKTFATLLVLFSLPINLLFAQGGYAPAVNIPVTVNGNIIKNPWVGGFDAPVFSEIDLNGDGIKDLFVFEKSGNRIYTFINNGTPNTIDYVYAPEYRNKFPAGMHDWVILTDFDCDGLDDIFTYTYYGGIAAYKNTFTIQNGLEFELIDTLVRSKYGTISTNLYVKPSSKTAFVDIDYDGDLDVLTVTGLGGSSTIEFHKNMAQENFGRCDTFDFHFQQACFGDFGFSYFPPLSAVFNISCRNMPVINESITNDLNTTQTSDMTLLALDIDGDNDYDLLASELASTNLLLVINGGDSANAVMVSQDIHFPSYDSSVVMSMLPAPYYLDVNNDGAKDLLVAPFLSGSSENYNNVWYYQNTTNNSTNIFNFQTNRFLVDEMIDVGSGALVVFHDVDSDGLTDMVIGNYGYYMGVSTYNCGLAYYRNTGTSTAPAFEFVTNDFANLFSLNQRNVAPTFGDVDGDGDMDMMIGNFTGTILFFTNTAGAGNFPVYTLTQAALTDHAGSIIDIGSNSVPQLIDVNRDGKLDLLIGERNGNINYYENTGTPGNPEFTFVTDSFGGILINAPNSPFSYSFPHLYDSAGTYQLLVGTLQGYIYQYNNIDNNLNGTFTLVDSMYYGIYEPERASVAVADLDSDGIVEILTGNQAGGVVLYQYDSSIGLNEFTNIFKSSKVYPNPARELVTVETTSTLRLPYSIVIYDIFGRKVLEQNATNFKTVISISDINSGIYIIEVCGHQKKKEYHKLNLMR